MRRTLRLLILAVLLPLTAAAQETRGNISGTVRDAQGVVPGAMVRITNIDTKVTQNLVTNDSGYFEAPLLNPGTYEVNVQMPGFKAATRNDIVLGVGQQVTVPFMLEVGAISEEIVVRAETPLLDTSAVSSGGNFDTPPGRQPADVLEHADHAVALRTGRQRERRSRRTCRRAMSTTRRSRPAPGSACRLAGTQTGAPPRSAATTTRSTAPTTTAATAASPRRRTRT